MDVNSSKCVKSPDGTADNIYDVEGIRDRRWNKNLKIHEYLIKWLNYPESANEWVAVQHLNCNELLVEFNCERARNNKLRNKPNKEIKKKRSVSVVHLNPETSGSHNLVKNITESDSKLDIELEEEENTPLNLASVPCKIVPDGEENGFDRDWEIENVLSVHKVVSLNGDHKLYAVVKFKRFKYCQQLPLASVRENALPQLQNYFKETIIRMQQTANLFI